jgi:hypothetical protein
MAVAPLAALFVVVVIGEGVGVVVVGDAFAFGCVGISTYCVATNTIVSCHSFVRFEHHLLIRPFAITCSRVFDAATGRRGGILPGPAFALDRASVNLDLVALDSLSDQARLPAKLIAYGCRGKS